MKKQVRAQRGRKARPIGINSVRILKHQKCREADTALEIVEAYEAVERTYRAAVMGGEHNRVAYSTNY
jgi:hypothetical protein